MVIYMCMQLLYTVDILISTSAVTAWQYCSNIAMTKVEIKCPLEQLQV